jgi:formylglycine-generating enzyme required for sulfatase activity
LPETASFGKSSDLTERDQPRTKARLGIWLVTLLLLICVPIGWMLFGPKAEENNSDKMEDAFNVSQKQLINSISMKFARIPAGRFMMGTPKEDKDYIRFSLGDSTALSDDEEHEVEISRPFYLGVHEVTQEQYERVMDRNPSFWTGVKQFDNIKGMDTRRFPVENVSWEEAVKFCKKLSELAEEKQAGRSYRLPTEAEWEYACRGGANSSKLFHFGHSLSSKQANFISRETYPHGKASRDYLGRPCNVGAYPANAFGLHDMHGNVAEWCQDLYRRYDGTKDPTKEGRVVRGGGWNTGICWCRSARRSYDEPDNRNYGRGFRAVCEVGTR